MSNPVGEDRKLIIETVEPKWYTINSSAIPSKLAHLFLGVTIGTTEPYINLLLINAGLSPSRAGIVNGISKLMWFLGSVLWGVVAGYYRNYRLLLLVAVIGAVSMSVPIPWVPELLSQAKYTVEEHITLSSNISTAAATGNSSTAIVVKMGQSNSNNSLFYVMLTLYPSMMLFDTFFSTLTDAAVMNQVVTSKRKIDYGRTRLFLPLGGAIGSFISSIMFKIDVSLLKIAKYSIQSFTLYPLAAISILINGHFLLKKTILPKNSEVEGKKVLKCLSETICQRYVMFFLCTTYMFGTMDGLNWNFAFVLMAEHTKQQILLGTAAATAFLSSTALYFVLSKLIKSIGGPLPMMGTSLICYSIRFLVYGYSKSAILFVVIQVLNGISVSAFVTAALMHTEAITPRLVKVSMYGLVNGLMFGAGSLTANMVGGILYQNYGGKILFRGASMITFVWGLLVFLCYFFYRKRKDIQDALETTLSSSEDREASLRIIES